MKNKSKTSERRNFIKGSLMLSAGLISAPILSHATKPKIKTNSEGLYIIGPKKGYSPEIGTLLSTLTMMRKWVVDTVKDLSVEQLDFQIDEQSNSIEAMLYHLAATEKYYQLHTFNNLEWGSWSDEIKQEWDCQWS